MQSCGRRGVGRSAESTAAAKLWYRGGMMEEEEEEVLGMLDKVLEEQEQEQEEHFLDGDMDLDSPLCSGEISPHLLRTFQVRREERMERGGRGWPFQVREERGDGVGGEIGISQT